MSRESSRPARTRICIISFSPIYRDARVLRQLEYLSPYYDLTVIGYGPERPNYPGVKWRPVEVHSDVATRVSGVLLMLAGRIVPRLYDVWYWQKRHHKKALKLAVASRSAVYHANDWNALPVAAEAARLTGGKLVFDAHEYSPLEYENRHFWRLFYAPLVVHMLRKYSHQITASTTVAEPIAERYGQEFGFRPILVLNAPRLVPLSPKLPGNDDIRLVHHGVASAERHLELMIETLARLDSRFSLSFFLVPGTPGYVQSLRELADRVAPGRVFFEEPIPPASIVPSISEYDMGFYLLKPENYNNQVALPNKLFDFLAAGLAICVGPAPSMAALVEQYSCGLVAPSFDPVDVAAMLNRLTSTELSRMQHAAREAAQHFNADKEMGKLVHLYSDLLASK